MYLMCPNINSIMSPFDELYFSSHLQDIRAVCGRAGDHLLRRERLLHVLQQPALAQPLPVCLQAARPGSGSTLRKPSTVPDVSTEAMSMCPYTYMNL